MSDGTKSGYAKTGKKVMCTSSNRRDLTYKKVYDVFTNQDGVDFIIDDLGVKRYESLEFPSWCEKSDGMVDKANETKHKFKVGDKVKVVSTYYTSQFVDVINVGDAGDAGITGVIISIDDNDYITPYLVRFDDSNVGDSWWFTNKCIELVGDDTKSGYTKTGKKVKSIRGGRVDLTYNGVYDVFIDNKGDEFIIDDIGDKRYWSISDDDYYELVDDVVDNTNETKLKFKVGDKVKVVDIWYISQATSDIKVGDVGVITYVDSDYVDSDYVMSPYRVEFDDESYWWFTEKCIELVNDDTDTIENSPTESAPIVSDGGSSSYYAQQIPKGMLERFNATGVIEAKDVIRLFLGNDFNMGNIFKAYCRIISLRNGKGKAGIDEQYDLTKVKYFAEDELNYYLENKDV